MADTKRNILRGLVAGTLGALMSAILPGVATAQSGGTTYQDWQVDCPANAECLATHRQTEAMIVAGPSDQDGSMQFAILVAADAQEGTPVAIRLPDGTNFQLRVGACGENFCEAGAAPDKVPQVLDRLRAAADGLVVYMAAGQVVFSEVSFLGFTKALQHVQTQ